MKLILAFVILASMGCGVSRSTGPSQDCKISFAQTGEGDLSGTTASGVGDSVQQCGPSDSPNRQKNDNHAVTATTP